MFLWVRWPHFTHFSGSSKWWQSQEFNWKIWCNSADGGKGFKIPDLTENLTIKGLIVADDNDDDDDNNEDDSLEWSQGSYNQLDLSKTILKFYPSCFHHLARLGSHSNIFRCDCISGKYSSFVLNSSETTHILGAYSFVLELSYNSLSIICIALFYPDFS